MDFKGWNYLWHLSDCKFMNLFPIIYGIIPNKR